MLTELPEMSDFSSLNAVNVLLATCMVMPELGGYHYCMPLETLLALKYNSFILTVGIISDDSYAIDMCGNSHCQVHVYCWKYHPCID